LNREGVQSPGQYRREQWAKGTKRPTGKTYKEVRWSGASVKQVVASPSVVGDRRIVTPGHKQVVRDWQEKVALLRRQGVGEDELPKQPPRTYEAPQKGYYPGLISEEEQAGILLAMQRRRPAQLGQVSQIRWLASGLTFCVCGEPIGATCSMRKDSRTYWLRCRGRANGTGCAQPGVKLVEAQNWLLTSISADTFLAMFDAQQGGQKQTALAAAMAAQANAQGVVDQVAAVIAAGEAAMGAEADAAVLGVLARRQAQQELKLADAKAALMAAQGELQQLQTRPAARVVAVEAQRQVMEMIRTFARGDDTVDDRRAVQHHLRRMGLKVHADGTERQLGLQVGDGEIHWAPIAPQARAVAARLGASQPAVVIDEGDWVVVSQSPLTPEELALIESEGFNPPQR
jgi:hypothetical protein